MASPISERSALQNKMARDHMRTENSVDALAASLQDNLWLGLEVDWDLWHAMHGAKASEIHRLEPLRTSA